MAGYVLDRVDFTKPTGSYSTEYDTKYNRQLWDSATRSHYFQLSKDRRRRMLQATKHAPIHWDSNRDSGCDDTGSIPSGYLRHRQNQRFPEEKGYWNAGATSPEPPKRIKSAWCEEPSRPQSQASDFVILDKRDSNGGRDNSPGTKRSNGQRSPTPAFLYEENRKRLRTPGSSSQSAICRPKSAPSSRLSETRDYSRPWSQNSKSRPRTGTGESRPCTGVSVSRPSSAASRPGSACTIRSSNSKSSDYTKLPPPRVQSRTSLHKNKQDSSKQASAPFALYGGESETARSHELRDHRVKNAAKGLQIGFKNVGANKLRDQNVDMTDLPRDIRLWVTEYQGNFKAFNPI